jgi:cathepsin L
MKSIFLVAIVLVSVAFAAGDQLNSDWEQWKLIHKRSYSIVEDKLRKEIFSANAERIASHNRLFDLGLKSYRMGLNKFSDMTPTERAEKFLGGKLPASFHGAGPAHIPSGRPLADDVDWRTKNIVTEIKNQGSCGSCWAFSTTGSVEGQHALATGKRVSLSEQQLVDCTTVEPYNNAGCGGGWMNVSFQYIQDNGGIESEQSYPYKGEDGNCHYDKTKRAAGVTGFKNIKEGSEKDLQDAVANVGPISVAIEVENNFFDYTGGIYDGSDCYNQPEYLNHGVLVVGYGTESGKDYYIVKNSWGQWGENGYIRMARNSGDKCGIALAASYPLVK